MQRVRAFLAATVAGVLLLLPTGRISATTCVDVPLRKPIHRLFGVVLFVSGDRISNAIVTVLQGSKEIAEQQTDKDGKFSFDGLKAGHYEIRVKVKGLEGAVDEQIVLVNPKVNSKRELEVRMTPNGIFWNFIGQCQGFQMSRLILG
jgi:hypothetical protein